MGDVEFSALTEPVNPGSATAATVAVPPMRRSRRVTKFSLLIPLGSSIFFCRILFPATAPNRTRSLLLAVAISERNHERRSVWSIQFSSDCCRDIVVPFTDLGRQSQNRGSVPRLSYAAQSTYLLGSRTLCRYLLSAGASRCRRLNRTALPPILRARSATIVSHGEDLLGVLVRSRW